MVSGPPDIFRWHIVCCRKVKPAALELPNEGIFCLAELRGGLGYGIKDGLELRRRTIDDLDHIRRGSLLLQRLGKLARLRLLGLEQARVLDSDHGLAREALQQINFSVGKGPHLLAVDDKDSEQSIILT